MAFKEKYLFLQTIQKNITKYSLFDGNNISVYSTPSEVFPFAAEVFQGVGSPNEPKGNKWPPFRGYNIHVFMVRPIVCLKS